MGMVDRLMQFQAVAQMIRIERAHDVPLLMNPNNIELETQEVSGVMKVADHLCHLRYCGCSDEEQRKMSLFAAGLLPIKIVELFREVEKLRTNRFQLYAAHDNTIMAMMAFMGFKDWPIPEFAAHLIFELYERDGQWEVEFIYNPDPLCYTFEGDPLGMDLSPRHGQDRSTPRPIFSRHVTVFEPVGCTAMDTSTFNPSPADFTLGSKKRILQPVCLPKTKSSDEAPPITSWKSRRHGAMTLKDFEQILLDERHCFMNDQEWNDAHKTHLKPELKPWDAGRVSRSGGSFHGPIKRLSTSCALQLPERLFRSHSLALIRDDVRTSEYQ